MAFQIKQNDTRPAYIADLRDNFGEATEAAINLATATSVTFIMRATGQTGIPKVRRTMTIVSAATGRVQHTWLATDTNTVGTFDVEFEIAWSDGGIETVPNGSYVQVKVVDDLDA